MFPSPLGPAGPPAAPPPSFTGLEWLPDISPRRRHHPVPNPRPRPATSASDGAGLYETRDNDNHNHRSLGSNDDYESYLVDSDGNEYEPYSLAWRYLGMYLDCDVDDYGGDYGGGDDGDGDFERRDRGRGRDRDRDRRRMSGDGDDDGDGDGDGDGDDCGRKVLWAAYVDPKYKGGTIGEYQFYDVEAEEWDASTCKTNRCARVDCHEPNTHYRLVGVYKESDGLEDWSEQLFKHEGYCLWDDDTYELMQTYREKWPTYCIQLYYGDDYGNTLYLSTKPLPEGNITMGVYYDEYCSLDSNLTLSDYIYIYYANYYGNYEKGEEVAAEWEYAIDSWNEGMAVYKICQPCRAYNLFKNNDHYDQEDNGRLLGNDENDGEGEEEQWGYNCYDDAGYTNCNQCYKFETKTDREEANAYDLARASSQGTILKIKAYGTVYGNGGYTSPPEASRMVAIFTIITAGGMAVGCVLALALRYYRGRGGKGRDDVPTLGEVSASGSTSGSGSLKETFKVHTEDAVVT